MKKSWRAIGAVILLASAGAFFLGRPQLVLEVSDENGRIVYLRPVAVGERYTVRFIHSVARRPVDEIYEIAPDCSILRETAYDMMGAGLPTEALPGQTFSVENGRYRIRGFDMRLPALTYRIDRVVADHRLLIGGEEFQLKKWIAAPGKPLTFRVRRVRMAETLAFRVKNLRQ